MKACTDLFAEILVSRENISGPHERTVFLASKPCTAHKVDNVFLPVLFLSFVEHAGILSRVNISDLFHRACGVAVALILVRRKLRLCFIQPECADAEICIIFLYFLPYILSCSRICCIQKDIIPMEQHLYINTCVALYKESLLFHFFVIFTSPVNLRPDGNHRFDAHLMQLIDHRLRIREIFFVKTVIAASWPVIVVDHENIQRNAAFFVLARHVQNLLLIVVAQLALPEAQAVLRHHRNFTNGICEVLLDLRRSIACGYPVVELFCGARQPFGRVRSEMYFADRCIVPQEAVAKARYIKRNARLRIAVRQFQVASLQVHPLLLILSHTINLLIRVGIEGYFQMISAAL